MFDGRMDRQVKVSGHRIGLGTFECGQNGEVRTWVDSSSLPVQRARHNFWPENVHIEEKQLMDPQRHTVSVCLGQQAYPVYIGESLIERVGGICLECGLTGRAAIVTDRNVGEIYGETVSSALANEGFKASSHLVEPGESSKSFETAAAVCEDLARHGINRQSFVVALGGGVIGDLAGFVAAIYNRGIPVVQVPTTVMAQVDSSVGGKTAINLSAGKNLVGAFHQPRAVLADTDTLNTLGTRERNEGFAEVIKYGVIRERELLSELRHGVLNLPELVRRCVAIKASFVEADEKETTGHRALLNFGHTLGHGIEAAAGYGTLLHGEAVALGMVAAAHVSARRVGFPEREVAELIEVIKHFNLPTKLPQQLSRAEILRKALMDKKFADGKIRFVVANRLGNAFLSSEVTVEDLEFGLSAIEL
jgi:3-dehydroquinate synthase